MDFNSTVDLIIRDLNEAREIIDDFRNYPGVPLIQVELAKSKCRNAAEIISMLKTISDRVQKPEAEKPGDEITQEREGKRKKEAEKHNDEILQDRNVSLKTVAEENTATPSSELHQTKEEIHPGGIIADTFSNLPGSLNEQLGAMREDDKVSGIIKGKPITNLAEAIGVNDRFMFIREIFAGNAENYNQAIVKLNEAADINDARAIILSYTGSNAESDASRQLLDLVRRKFPSNE